MPSRLEFTIDLRLNLIQAVRLSQALSESTHEFRVPAAHVTKFEYLAKTFPIEVLPAAPGTPVLQGLELNHEIPRTSIGALQRPLIFPVAIFDHLRTRWETPRPIRFSFMGLVTEKRVRSLAQWYERARDDLSRPTGALALRQSVERVRRRLAWRAPIVAAAGKHPELLLLASARGRQWPIKAWDAAYYDELCRSEFVLCPDGDLIWTYRFFEAIMCGAVPIVENDCDHYRDFVYFTMETPLCDLRASPEMLMHNFELCGQRLTLSRPELDVEVERLLSDGPIGLS